MNSLTDIIRVFPRKTTATPDDDLVRIGVLPTMFDKADEVHISVTFKEDLGIADYLYSQWKHVADTKIGGAATGQSSGEFVPGMYLKHGYTITSRGCPNNCWFCDVWKREGDVREIEIKPGWNLLDDNILACSDDHIKAVFKMLGEQDRPAELTGGLEAARLKQWHVEELYKLKPKQLFFAYDTPNDYEPLVEASKLLLAGGFTASPKSHRLRCYVLCGYPKDTFEKAELRIKQVAKLGYFPMGMVYQGKSGINSEWRAWRRLWCNPYIIHSLLKHEQ